MMKNVYPAGTLTVLSPSRLCSSDTPVDTTSEATRPILELRVELTSPVPRLLTVDLSLPTSGQ